MKEKAQARPGHERDQKQSPACIPIPEMAGRGHDDFPDSDSWNNSPYFSGTFNRTDVTPNVAWCSGQQNLYSRSSGNARRRFSPSTFTICANDALTDGHEVVFSQHRGRCSVPMVYYNVKL
jgi:hypothetical protein